MAKVPEQGVEINIGDIVRLEGGAYKYVISRIIPSVSSCGYIEEDGEVRVGFPGSMKGPIDGVLGRLSVEDLSMRMAKIMHIVEVDLLSELQEQFEQGPISYTG